MNSYYKFTQILENKYPNLSLPSSALKYEQTYDCIIINNIYDTTHKYKKVKTTNLTLQEIRNYLLDINYCSQIYLENFNSLNSLLSCIEVEFNNKLMDLLEAHSLISLLPYCGLNQINIGSNLYNYLTNIKPYYYQVLKLYL